MPPATSPAPACLHAECSREEHSTPSTRWSPSAADGTRAAAPRGGGLRALAVGRAAVNEIVRRFADRVRPTTPRLGLVPLDLRVAVGGPLAVATLLVRDADGRTLRRRTFVPRRPNGRWLISHLHALDLATPASP